MFSFEFCEISKNTFFTEYLQWLLLHLWVLYLETFSLRSFSICHLKKSRTLQSLTKVSILLIKWEAWFLKLFLLKQKIQAEGKTLTKKELPTKKNFRIMTLIQKFKREWPTRNLPGTVLAAQKFRRERWHLWSKWRRCMSLLMKFWIRWCLRDIKKIVLNSTLRKDKQCLIAKFKTKGCQWKKN